MDGCCTAAELEEIPQRGERSSQVWCDVEAEGLQQDPTINTVIYSHLESEDVQLPGVGQFW